MAKFTTYAEVLTPDHALMKAHKAGISKLPGNLLGNVLAISGGAYEMTVEFPPRFREAIRQVAELTSDSQLLALADRAEVKVSLDHLRNLPLSTRIVVGAGISYEPGESEALGLGESGPPDPKTTILLEG